jgi:hypothetical protein
MDKLTQASIKGIDLIESIETTQQLQVGANYISNFRKLFIDSNQNKKQALMATGLYYLLSEKLRVVSKELEF